LTRVCPAPLARAGFPTLLSYQRFTSVDAHAARALVAYLHPQLGRCTGISFIDSTKLAFCLTQGLVDDRRPVPKLARRLFGTRFGA
jgi:hypothetical protein